MLCNEQYSLELQTLLFYLSGYQSGVFEKSMSEDLQPVLEAATSMVVKTGYALLCLVVTMLIVHVVGAVLFHFLRTRHKFPVHRVFISTQPPCGAHHTQNLPPPKDSDTDSDDNDGFKTYTSQRGTLPRHQGAPPAETLLQGEFQYSETKV